MGRDRCHDVLLVQRSDSSAATTSTTAPPRTATAAPSWKTLPRALLRQLPRGGGRGTRGRGAPIICPWILWEEVRGVIEPLWPARPRPTHIVARQLHALLQRVHVDSGAGDCLQKGKRPTPRVVAGVEARLGVFHGHAGSAPPAGPSSGACSRPPHHLRVAAARPWDLHKASCWNPSSGQRRGQRSGLHPCVLTDSHLNDL